jgi:hypothetical protein
MERKETKKQLPIFQFFLLYLRRMETPKAVIKAAGWLAESFGTKFEYLGQYNGREAFVFVFPKDEFTGFPFVYLYNEDKDRAQEVTGYDALDIIRLFPASE